MNPTPNPQDSLKDDASGLDTPTVVPDSPRDVRPSPTPLQDQVTRTDPPQPLAPADPAEPEPSRPPADASAPSGSLHDDVTALPASPPTRPAAEPQPVPMDAASTTPMPEMPSFRGMALKHPAYRIVGPIGKGGMGEVLEGEQISLGRRVAIKVLSPDLARNTQYVERFRREARALARLNHPHIVTIYERGESQGMLFFVMEYVAGPNGSAPTDLKHVLRGGQPTPEQARRWMTQVTDALTHTHAASVIHRDIKPSNVMLTERGDAKVSDFGIASASASDPSAQLTSPGGRMGTEAYMAPEQNQDAASVDGRADVWSCGVMFYELLTGRLPQGAYQPPSFLVPAVSPAWDAVIERALQADREHRYPDMLAFHEAVQALRTVAERDQDPGAGSKTDRDETLKRHLELAHGFVDDLRRITDDAGRFEAADQALSAVKRAEAIAPEHPTAVALKEQAAPIAKTLAWQLGERAYDASRFAEAETYFRWLVDRDNQHRRAQVRLADLRTRRESAVSEALSLSKTGDLPAAIQSLKQAQQQFPEDVEVSRLLNLWRGQSDQARELQEALPRLDAQTRYVELKRQIEQAPESLRTDPSVRHYLDKAEKRLASVQPTIEAARRCIANNEFASASRKTARVLQAVVDHPEAMEVKADADTREQARQQELQNLETIVNRGKWIDARNRLNALSSHSELFHVLSEAKTLIEVGLAWQLAQRRWLVAATSGFLILAACSFLALVLQALIPKAESITLASALVYALVQTGVFACAALIGVALARRPRRWPLWLAAGIGLILAGVGGFGQWALNQVITHEGFVAMMDSAGPPKPLLTGLLLTVPHLVHSLGLAGLCATALAVFRGGVAIGRILLITALASVVYALVAGGLPPEIATALKFSPPPPGLLPLVAAGLLWIICAVGVGWQRRPATAHAAFAGLTTPPTDAQPSDPDQATLPPDPHAPVVDSRVPDTAGP